MPNRKISGFWRLAGDDEEDYDDLVMMVVIVPVVTTPVVTTPVGTTADLSSSLQPRPWHGQH